MRSTDEVWSISDDCGIINQSGRVDLDRDDLIAVLLAEQQPDMTPAYVFDSCTRLTPSWINSRYPIWPTEDVYAGDTKACGVRQSLGRSQFLSVL